MACYLDTSGREGGLVFSVLSFPSPKAFCGLDEKEVEGKKHSGKGRAEFLSSPITHSGPVCESLKAREDRPIILATPLIGVYLLAL